MESPIVSIILPTYNGKKERLKESINSVLNQSFKNFELIILNDASTNNIEKTILEYEKKDTRIKYIKNKENLKLTKTLNKGLKYSKGKYIARIDDDDIWINQDKLKEQITFMESHLDYGICGAGKVTYINEEGKTINIMNMRLSDSEIRKTILQANQFVHSSIIVRKNILDEIGFYNPNYNKAEDYELWCRIGCKYKFYNMKNIGIKYRINSNGITRKNYFYQKLLTFKICMKYRKYYPHIYKAIILRIGDFILPIKIINFFIKTLRP